MAASEIRRGEFIYQDTLFVDLGSSKRHPRASPSELKDLLLPKKSGAAPKDQVAHWYEAQLIHYGLPRSKDKNTAKVRLTNAISAKTLAVPKEVVSMEAEMKKDFASLLRKGKNAAGAGKKASEVAATSKAKKATSNTAVELEIDGIKLKINREDVTAAKKKAMGKTTGKEVTPKAEKKGAKASNSAPKSSGTKAAAAKSSPLKPTKTASTPRPKQTARPSQPTDRSTGVRPASSPAKSYNPHRLLIQQRHRYGRCPTVLRQPRLQPSQPRVLQ